MLNIGKYLQQDGKPVKTPKMTPSVFFIVNVNTNLIFLGTCTCIIV